MNFFGVLFPNVFCDRFLIKFCVIPMTFFNVFVDEFGQVKTLKKQLPNRKKNIDFVCFPRLENLRFHIVFCRFTRKTRGFLVFSIGSHGKHVFSYGFPLVQTENVCFPIDCHGFPWNTCVFLMFSIGSNIRHVFSYCFP